MARYLPLSRKLDVVGRSYGDIVVGLDDKHHLADVLCWDGDVPEREVCLDFSTVAVRRDQRAVAQYCWPRPCCYCGFSKLKVSEPSS